MNRRSSTFSVNNKKCVVWGALTGAIAVVIIIVPGTTGSNRVNTITKKLEKNEYQGNVELQAILASMKNRWKERLIGNSEKSSQLSTYPYAANYTEVLSREGQSLLDSRVGLKTLKQPRSARLTSEFNKLLTLAKAYGTKGTALYKKEDVLEKIIDGLQDATKPGKYDGNKYYGNWWDWQIGIPQSFLPTIFIIEDELPKHIKIEYAQKINKYIPNALVQMKPKPQYTSYKIEHPISTSFTNRVDIALGVIGVGMLLENPIMIRSAVDSIRSELNIVKEKNGFYEDGSLIYHGSFPYAGIYGNDLIYGASQIFTLIANTKWQIKQEMLDHLVSQTRKSFIPLLVKGEMMAMVRGRAASRPPEPLKQGYKSVTPLNILCVAEFAKDSNKNTLLQAAKYWINKNVTYYMENARDFKDFYLITAVMNNLTIDTETKPFKGSVVFGSMDRAVFSNSYYTAGISMYSNRISAFATGNKENQQGWHTSDGMLYLYNGDQQFSSGYWPTVDPYRLPGTTVDTVELQNEVTAWQEPRSSEPFVGGVTNGNFSVVMMQLNKKETLNNGIKLPMNLEAKKSWFMFGDAIIALGSDINGDTDATIETVIENRMLDEGVSYKISHKVIDGKEWFLLQGPDQNRSLAYLMLQKQTWQVYKGDGVGTYEKINEGFPNDIEYRRRYQKILLVHGKHVRNGSYAYAIVPNADEAIMANMTNRFDIIQNTEKVQAVYDSQQKLLGVVIWDKCVKGIKGYELNTSGSFLIQELESMSLIALSNPKQTAETLKLTLPFNIKNVKNSSSIHVSMEHNTVIINTTNGLGKSFTIEVIKQP